MNIDAIFSEKNPPVDAVIAASGVTLIYFGSYGLGKGIDSLLFYALPVVFIASGLYFYWSFRNK
jgi:hypothetical protein